MDFQLSPEQRDLQDLVRGIVQKEIKPLASRWDQTHQFPWDSVNALARVGVLGLTIPEQYGGVGAGWFEAVLAIEEVARGCYQTAMAVLGELGVQTQAIVHFGSEEHKQRYLPAVARGELICAICMTEPDAGSDLGAIQTRAVAWPASSEPIATPAAVAWPLPSNSGTVPTPTEELAPSAAEAQAGTTQPRTTVAWLAGSGPVPARTEEA
ncbi:MAG TPA: acyl-CoA dehydrogenase family protein, partial [Chloroflexota bacterium]